MSNSTEENIALIEASDLLQVEWYLAQHADSAKSPVGVAEHYLRIGAQLLYDPSPGFSTRRYLRANPDVAAAGMNPLVHYLRFGRGEGRPCFPVGNYTEDDNPPLIVARSTREIDRDMQAIRRTRLFDPDYYLGAYPRSEEHTSELQSLIRNSSAVFCLKNQHQLPANK